MSEEIEKKFLLRELPNGITNGTKIRQGYLSAGDPEERVRAKGEKFFNSEKRHGFYARRGGITKFQRRFSTFSGR